MPRKVDIKVLSRGESPKCTSLAGLSLIARSIGATMALVLAAFAGNSAAQQRTEAAGPRNIVFEAPGQESGLSNAGVFVGINQFDDEGVTPLRFAVNDAVQLCHLFVEELKLIDPKRCALHISGDPVGEPTKRRLEALKQKQVRIVAASKVPILDSLIKLKGAVDKERGVVISSFSSHGFSERRQAYVMPSDGRRAALDDTALNLRSFEQHLENVGAAHRLLLIDACQERASLGARGDGAIAGAAMTPDFLTIAFGPTGQATLTSCDANQFSYEDGRLSGGLNAPTGHGVFTHALLDALRGGAACDEQNLVTLGAVIDHVDSTVRRWVKEENQVRMPHSLPSNQTPAYHGPVHTRSLPLARKAGDLRALAAAVERLPADAQPTGDLRLQLVDLLRKADPQGDADRTLISRTSAFVNRKLEGDLFVDFLRGELQRRKLRPSDAPLSSKPSVGVPGMNAAARPFEPFENSIGMRFTYVPPGRFRMGSPPDEVDRGEDEDQVEAAAVAGFHLGVFEVTSREFAAVMGGPPGKDGAGKIAQEPPMDATETANLPASSVSWDMAVEFCRKLSEASAEKAAGRRYRLPREVEWEYACRAGTKTPFSCGSDLSSEFAWFSGARQRRDRPRAVGAGKPNAWGLYDMHGNVREWCADRYASLLEATLPSLPTAAPTDQLPAREPIERVLRGGSWFNSQADCRSAARLSEKPGKRTTMDGFRVVCEINTREP